MPVHDGLSEYLHLVGGVVPGASSLSLVEPPRLFGGERPTRFFVCPLTRPQDQQDRNSCNPHAHVRPIESVGLAVGITFQISLADLYSGALYFDGNEGKDVGTTMSAVGRWINEMGLLSSFDRPYKTDNVTVRTPARFDRLRAKGPKVEEIAVEVEAIQDALLISGGVPYGHEVRENYKPNANGVLPVPAGKLNGYHATTFEGWDNEIVTDSGLGAFLMAQHWGKLWGIDHPRAADDARFSRLAGQKSYCWFPYAYVRKPKAVFSPHLVRGKLEVT